MKAILDFISNNGFGIFMFILFFGGGIGTFFHRLAAQRHERKMAEARQKHRLAVLAEQRRIAEVESDAIKLLVADEALGEDFNRRLRIALDKAKENTRLRIVEESPDEETEDEDAEEVTATKSKRTKSRRR